MQAAYPGAAHSGREAMCRLRRHASRLYGLFREARFSSAESTDQRQLLLTPACEFPHDNLNPFLPFWFFLFADSLSAFPEFQPKTSFAVESAQRGIRRREANLSSSAFGTVASTDPATPSAAN